LGRLLLPTSRPVAKEHHSEFDRGLIRQAYFVAGGGGFGTAFKNSNLPYAAIAHIRRAPIAVNLDRTTLPLTGDAVFAPRDNHIGRELRYLACSDVYMICAEFEESFVALD
jgi:hypothetical protein